MHPRPTKCQRVQDNPKSSTPLSSKGAVQCHRLAAKHRMPGGCPTWYSMQSTSRQPGRAPRRMFRKGHRCRKLRGTRMWGTIAFGACCMYLGTVPSQHNPVLLWNPEPRSALRYQFASLQIGITQPVGPSAQTGDSGSISAHLRT
jgi:hypothetical protein